MKTLKKRVLSTIALTAMLFCATLPASAACSHSLVKVNGTYLGSCEKCGAGVYIYKCKFCDYMLPLCVYGHRK